MKADKYAEQGHLLGKVVILLRCSRSWTVNYGVYIQ